MVYFNAYLFPKCVSESIKIKKKIKKIKIKNKIKL